MDGEAMKDHFTDARKGSAPVSETGDGQSGMPPERVTLEITREAWRRATPTSPDNWAYAAREAGITFLPGESVRVVDTHAEAVAESVAWEGARDAYRGRIARLTDERNILRARVAELEGVQSFMKSPAESCKAERDAGNGGCGACAICCGELLQKLESMESAPAASVAAERIAAELLARGGLRETVKRLEAMSQDPGRTVVWEEFDANEDGSVKKVNEVAPAASRAPTVGQLIEETCKQLALALRVADIEKRRGDKCFGELNAARARVAELESAPAARRLYDIGHKISPFMTFSSGPDGCIVEIKFKSLAEGQTFHDAMVKFFTTAPPASGAARTEPVTWGIACPGNPTFGNEVFTVRATEEIAKEVYRSCDGWIHFPLFAAPQPAKGWLTEEERKAVEYFSTFCDTDIIPDNESEMSAKLRNLLARDTPPEVVLTAVSSYENAPGNRVLAACDVISAIRKAGCEVVTPSHWQIAAAGVTCKEVG